MSDDQLLETHQKKRNRKAFKILYDRLSPRIRAWVWTFSRRYGLGRFEEDDIYSDVTLRILKSTRAYDPALGNASCYLYGLTRHAVFHFLQNKTRRRQRSLEQVDPKDLSPSSEQEPLWDAQVMRRGLVKLDARSRRVVLLHAKEGRSLKEIASDLKMTACQTRKCYRQAVERLRCVLAGVR